MTEEQQSNEEQSELESLGGKSGGSFWRFDWACDFLMETHPALLLLWSAAAIICAAIFSFVGIRAMMNSASDFQGSTIYLNEPAFLSTGLFAIPAFLLGVVGTLLPMWAVGRLIADAIKDGAKS